MSNEYKKDEQIIKTIINKNIKLTNPNNKLSLRIYYKNLKTHSLIIKNTYHNEDNNILKQHHLVYEFKCNVGDCVHQNNTYIGMTTTTLTRRLTMHKQDGAIKNHFQTTHNTPIERTHLDNNTRIIYKNHNFKLLQIAEAILIDKKQPTLNTQQQPQTILPTRKIINIQQNNENINSNHITHATI